jgi:cytoskeletal protein CcmA (bactofilin family)
MSPLRPALGSFSLRRTRGGEMRELRCPYCSHRFQASRRAMSLRCPSCTNPLAFEDFSLNERLEGQLSTMGQVQLGPSCHLSGNLTCADLTISGRFEGRATVLGPLLLKADGKVTGQVAARSLVVERGGVLAAKAKIAPTPDHPPLRLHASVLLTRTGQRVAAQSQAAASYSAVLAGR